MGWASRAKPANGYTENLLKQALLVAAFVICVRLPFLTEAVQGDDYYYLTAAEHAQMDPAHPHHARFVFLGVPIDMRGHPHPPGDAWILAGLLATFGDVREAPFHVAYLGLSLIAALSMLSLARRFVPGRAVEATLLFCAVPAFLVNGNSFEADLPFLAFWTLSFALVIARRYAWAAVVMVAATLMAYQSVVMIPILALWLWRQGELRRGGWTLAVPVMVFALYQVFERMTSGAAPVAVLNQHFSTYGLQQLTAKLRSAVALTGHLIVMASPLAIWALVRRRHWFLTSWVLIFYAAALVLFFAGSARYLLPLGPALALITAMYFEERRVVLWSIIAFQTTLGLALAWANYDHWAGYRSFVAEAAPAMDGHRTWVNAEWGLRYYAEAAGALPVVRGQSLRPGDVLISSALADQIPFTLGGGQKVEQMRREIRPRLPLRLIGLNSRSGYSAVAFGLWPFDISTAPVDIVTLSTVVERAPTLTWLNFGSPDSEPQVVSGVYSIEDGKWRWMSGRGVFLLPPLKAPARLEAEIYIPDASPARTVTVTLDGAAVAKQTFTAPGAYHITSSTLAPRTSAATVALLADREFTPPGDGRRLALIVTGLGYR